MRSNIIQIEESRFPIGMLVQTIGIQTRLNFCEIEKAVQRHAAGDWGDLDQEDKIANDLALERGERLLSAFRSKDNLRFYVITEADRSATTVLLSEEY